MTLQLGAAFGKLGGAEVESYSVAVPEDRPDTLLRAVMVPAGKRYLVAVEGYCPKESASVGYKPTLYVGTAKSKPAVRSGRFGVVAIVEQDVEVRFAPHSSSGINNSSFEGTVYVLEV